MTSYDALLRPIDIGNVTIKNRFVLLPMTTEMVDNYYITDRVVDFYQQRAQGGTGLVEVGSAYVCDAFDTTPLYHNAGGTCGIWDDCFNPGWKRLFDAIRVGGAKSAVQLQCCYEWRANPEDPFEPVGPSDGPGGPFVKHVRAMTTDEIRILISQYGMAAKRAKDAGCDIIEVHAGIGYMVMRFLSKYSNHRDDEYGGTLEKRCRLLTDILDEIHKTCGESMPVIVRISADDLMPGGNRIEDTLKIIPLVEKHGVDAWSVQVGFHEAPQPVANQFVPEGAFIDLARQVKTVTSKPVFPGTRIKAMETCAKVVNEGYGDMVGMARQFIADPETAGKVAAGHPERVRPCIVCSRCLDHSFLGKPIWCSVNGNVDNSELGLPEDRPVDNKKHIVVIGAGPGGLETARVASLRGHRVTVVDKSDRVGGLLNMAQVLNENIEPLVEWWRQESERMAVEFKLNTKATPSLVESLAPDEVVVAPGGSVIELDVDGIHGKNVVTSQDIKDMTAGIVPAGKGMIWKAAVAAIKAQGGTVGFMRMGLNMASGPTAIVGKRVVVVGGGFAGLECALSLSDNRDVTVIEEAAKLGNGIGIIDRKPEIKELESRGVRLLPSTRLVQVSKAGAVIESIETGEQKTIECDTVLVSLGVSSNTELAESLEKLLPGRVHLIGDATTEPGRVKRTLEAVNEGYRLGMTL